MSTFVGIGISKNLNPLEAAREATYKANYFLNQKDVNLAIIFNSAELTRLSLLKGIRQVIGDRRIIGCSGAGIISNFGIAKRGVAVMLISSTDITFHTAHIDTRMTDDPYLLGQKFVNLLIENQKNYLNKLCLYLCDGLANNIPQLTRGIQYHLGTSFPLMGILASDNLRFERTYQYFNQELLTDDIVGTALGGKLQFMLKTCHGLKPLGKPRLITKAKENTIHQIEHKPAVETYKEYFGKTQEELSDKATLQRISIFYPLGIYLEGEKEYLLRNILRIEPDGSLVCEGDTPEGAEVRLMRSTKESAIKAVDEAARQIKESFKDKRIYFALVFDSIFRYRLLSKSAYLEIEKLKEILPNVPFIGFYTFATIAPLEALNYRGQAHIHNEAISILAIGG